MVRFRPTTVIVGANNAGKSTIVEAIRLISLVANRHGSLNFGPPPDWISDPTAGRGVSPSLRDLNTNLSTVVTAGTAPPAKIRATFSGGETIDVFVNDDDRVFASVWNSQGHLISSKSQAMANRIPRVAVQPHVAPLALHENVLDERTVRRGMDSPLASQHFRNQLRFLYETDFDDFRRLSEDTWPRLQIRDLVGGDLNESDEIRLLVRDRAFVGEVGNMGHGLQMWLQIMWFLSRNRSAPTIVLDEPDVYMHPDLQRRLIQRLRGGLSQVLVATHSVEIMTEVEPTSVLIIDSEVPESPWASDVAGVQGAIDQIGGIHNLDLARLFSARRFLIVEGDDIDLLRRPYARLFPAADALDILPKLAVGGWSGWQRAIGAACAIQNAGRDSIVPYSIFDSDYHHPGEVCTRLEDAAAGSMRVHIWTRKELESYLLEPETIRRSIAERAFGRGVPDLQQLSDAIRAAAEELRNELVDNYAETFRLCHRRSSVPTATRWARNYLQARLDLGMELAHLVSGKRLISKMSSWATREYGANFGSSDLALSMRDTEVPAELAGVLSAIESGEPIDLCHRQHWYDLAPEFHLEPD